MTAQPWEPRVSRLEGAFEQIADRLNSMDGRIERLEAKIDTKIDALRGAVEGRFERLEAKVDGRFAQTDRKIDNGQWRLTALILGTWATTILTVLFHR